MSEKRLILVVEDERTISNFICRALAANDYKAMSATTGKEALSLFFSHRPDLVLLDPSLNVAATFVDGCPVYRREGVSL